MKLHRHNGVGSNGNGSRGKQLMIMLAFGAAIIGAMALHKVRERRVIDLLVQEKHNQLSSLQLLLQVSLNHLNLFFSQLIVISSKISSGDLLIDVITIIEAHYICNSPQKEDVFLGQSTR